MKTLIHRFRFNCLIVLVLFTTLSWAGLVRFDQSHASYDALLKANLSASDRDYLKTGGYSVKYLDYDWSLNE